MMITSLFLTFNATMVMGVIFNILAILTGLAAIIFLISALYEISKKRLKKIWSFLKSFFINIFFSTEDEDEDEDEDEESDPPQQKVKAKHKTEKDPEADDNVSKPMVSNNKESNPPQRKTKSQLKTFKIKPGKNLDLNKKKEAETTIPPKKEAQPKARQLSPVLQEIVDNLGGFPADEDYTDFSRKAQVAIFDYYQDQQQQNKSLYDPEAFKIIRERLIEEQANAVNELRELLNDLNGN